jgi:hypothetical protein
MAEVPNADNVAAAQGLVQLQVDGGHNPPNPAHNPPPNVVLEVIIFFTARLGIIFHARPPRFIPKRYRHFTCSRGSTFLLLFSPFYSYLQRY